MSKRKKATLLTICLLAAALVALLSRDAGPHYRGRSLYKWLVFYQTHVENQDPPQVKEAMRAITAIGTNAIPYLMKWIQQEPPPWQKSAPRSLFGSSWDIPPARLLIYGPGHDRADLAMLGFILLDTNAVSAIPGLATMVNDRNRPVTAQRAMTALSTLGLPAFPHLTAALSNTNCPTRYWAAMSLATVMAPAVGTNACLPPLIAALMDPDTTVRSAASSALNYLTNAPAH
jgi:hypothetical protein